MSKLEVPAVDAVRAKNMARAVQRRYQELGATVSLNHAYEAIAAVFGFETWSRMKARIDAGVETSDVAGQPSRNLMTELQNSILKWDDLVPGDLNPVVMVTGPVGHLTRKTLGKLMSGGKNHKNPRPTRMITRKVDAELRSVLLGGVNPLNVATIGRSASAIVNIFDTENGRRSPTPSHRERLLSFLSEILHQGADSAVPGARELLGAVIDRVYESTSDISKVGTPYAYTPGVDLEVDGALNSGVVVRPGVTTWWDIADDFMRRGKLALHRRALCMAMPLLDSFMPLLRDDRILNIYGTMNSPTGERLVEMAARKIANVIKEYPFLRKRSTVSVDFDAPVVFVELAVETDDPFEETLLQHIAFDTCKKGRFSLTSVGPNAERGVLVIEGVDVLVRSVFTEPFRDLLTKAHSIGPLVVGSVSSANDLIFFERWTTCNLVVGCETRTDVASIQRAAHLSRNASEQIHEYLFAPRQQHENPVAICSRRGFKTTTEGLVEVL